MNNKFVVYQHINAVTRDVFYIGSGRQGREKERGVLQRGALYNLYVANNNLQYKIGLSRQLKIEVQILSYHDTKTEAMQVEESLIKSNYGKDGYKLVNTQSTFIANEEMINKRSDIVRAAVSRKVIHVETDIIYSSITAMANATGINRVTLQQRLAKIVNNSAFRYQDGVTPTYTC